MELELAIAVTCEPAGCQVRYLEGGETSLVRYGASVQDRIKIRPGDLVAVDSTAQPPAVVWRWWQGRVERTEGATAVVSRKVNAPRPGDPECAEQPMPVPAWLAGSVADGDTVYHSGHSGKERRIVDLARYGAPLHPERVRSEAFPGILATYACMQDAP